MTLRSALLAGLLPLLACPAEAPSEPTPAPADDDDSAGADDDDSAPADDDDSAGADDDDSAGGDDDDSAEGPLSLGDLCFPEIQDPDQPGPDYEQFPLTVGSHCLGTDHQDIGGVQRVVFLGDSVTVGVPNLALDLSQWGFPAGAGTPEADFFRNRLAAELVSLFGLAEPGLEFIDWVPVFWQGVDLFAGTGAVRESGDFAICAKWGARNDDLLLDNTQLADCLPEEQRDKTTLVVITSGGNDLSNLTQNHIEGASAAATWKQSEEIVALLEDAVAWIKAPGRFPNGVHVVFGNMYEFTDGTGDTAACPAAALAGFDSPPPDPALLAEQVIWIQEEYLRIAVEQGADMIFMLEHFCGHGWKSDDPTARCYRGPNTERWFDLSCTHPNSAGHAQLADMFLSVVLE